MSHITVAREQTQVRVGLMMNVTDGEVPELHAVVRQEIGSGAREIVFDMSDTVTLDATGICFFMAVYNSLFAIQGRMRLLNVSGKILKLLRAMHLADRFNAIGTGREVTNG